MAVVWRGNFLARGAVRGGSPVWPGITRGAPLAGAAGGGRGAIACLIKRSRHTNFTPATFHTSGWCQACLLLQVKSDSLRQFVGNLQGTFRLYYFSDQPQHH